MSNYISDFFDEPIDELELPEIDISFDSGRIHALVSEGIQAETKPQRKLVRLLRTVLVAAVVMCVMTTSVFAVGKLLETYFPAEDEVFAVRPITITGYNGETVTEILGYATYDNVNLVLRFDVSDPNATVVAFQTEWLPDGTQFIGDINLNRTYNPDAVYTPNTFLKKIRYDYLEFGNYNKETRTYEASWLDQWRYDRALKKTGLTEEQASQWLVYEQYTCPDGGFNIEIIEANGLYDRDIVFMGSETVEIIEQTETEQQIILSITENTGLGIINHLLMYNKDDEYLIHICGIPELETMKKIGENLNILVTAAYAGDDNGYWDEELEWRFCSLGYGIG